MRQSIYIALALAFGTGNVAIAQQSGIEYNYEYDARGNLTRVINGAGAAEQTSYDALGRPSTMTDALSNATVLSHDGQDQLVEVLSPNGATTSYQVGGLGFIDTESSPDRGAVSFQRDLAGLPVVRTDARNARVETTFDGLGRPTEHRFYRPDGTLEATHVLTWDSGANGIGRIGEIDTGENQLEFGYDIYGKVTTRRYAGISPGAIVTGKGKKKRVVSDANVSLLTSWSYGASTGQLLSMHYPSGAAIDFSYDAAGRISAMSWDGVTIAGAIEYAAFGPPSAFSLASGLDHVRLYDLSGRIEGYSQAGETVALSYDAAGQLVETDPITDPSRLQQFAYDAAGRITGYVDPVNTIDYTYDGSGNRLSRLANGQSLAYGYAAASNRLSTAGTQAITMDAAGNIVSDGIRTLGYDAAGRLVSATRSSASASYQYNGLGERSRKISDDVTRHYVYDEAGHLIGEYDALGAPVVEYAWLGDLPVAARIYPANGSPETYAIETDHLGTPRVITDSAQRVRWRWTSAPFGNSPPEEDPNGLGAFVFNLRFPGQYYDDESGLHYNYFRDYDPGTGRYVESDPIGLEGGINTYGYVEGNPLSHTDPTGEIAFVPIAIGIGIELAVQAFTNYQNDCKVFDVGNYNWLDVGIAAGIGAIAPGWGSIGKNALSSGKAIRTLSGQRDRARTANRAAKIERRITDHAKNIAGPLAVQGTFQGAKYVANQITDAGGLNDCTCRQ